jgi:fibro-slime domain-containing protein
MKLSPWLVMVAVSACGPAPRPDGTDPLPDAKLTPDASSVAVDSGEPPPPCGQLTVTLRDFRDDHPDMQKGVGSELGLVRADLGLDNKPVFAPPGASGTVSGKPSFDQWYRDVPGINMPFSFQLPMVENPPGTFTFDDQDFFPLDGMGYGNQTWFHNFHFTTEIHSSFTYLGGEVFTFNGDDDVFVFVNKKLALDLGGVHGPMMKTIVFDAVKAQLGITTGQTYQLDVFHAERHTSESTFRMVTTISCLIIQ